MNEELTPQKERFLQEVERTILRKELDARLLEDGLVHVSWNEKPLCSVDRDGIVRFRPADIIGSEVDRQLRTVVQTAAQVKEYACEKQIIPEMIVCGVDSHFRHMCVWKQRHIPTMILVKNLYIAVKQVFHCWMKRYYSVTVIFGMANNNSPHVRIIIRESQAESFGNTDTGAIKETEHGTVDNRSCR